MEEELQDYRDQFRNMSQQMEDALRRADDAEEKFEKVYRGVPLTAQVDSLLALNMQMYYIRQHNFAAHNA